MLKEGCEVEYRMSINYRQDILAKVKKNYCSQLKKEFLTYCIVVPSIALAFMASIVGYYPYNLFFIYLAMFILFVPISILEYYNIKIPHYWYYLKIEQIDKEVGDRQ